MECTPLHIYFSLDIFFNCFIYACVLLTTLPFCNLGCISASRPDRLTPGERATGILYLIITVLLRIQLCL
jgi:hypothetical protein